MPADARLEQLSRLRSEVDRSLRPFLNRTGLLAPASGTSRGMARRVAASEAAVPALASNDAEAVSGAVVVNVNLMGGTIFLDDERRVRALAKEIRRLITEDTRRGLGIGG